MKSLTLSFTRVQRFARVTTLIGAMAGAAALLTGCYVVPMQPTNNPGPIVYAPAPQPVAPVTFSARLYPANDLAASYGMVSALVTNDLNGRGTFSTAINGENFTGEATRAVGASREGVANGAGNRGSYINCRYQMNSVTLGSGQCKLSNGALFTMHVGG
ncbi:MAG TPA: hypothetical protein PK497_02880 [Burkholderiaceae bacterium]|nr:hypothetical protein [Burkholderiaceae bacterium]